VLKVKCKRGRQIRYDTIEEFNVDSKGTRSQKKKQNKQRLCPFNTVQVNAEINDF